MNEVGIMEPIKVPETLAEMLRQHCSPEWQALLAEKTTWQSYNAGELIFREGDPAETLFIVRRGRAKVFSTFEPGASRILRFARDGQVLGHRGIGDDFTYTVSATALVQTVVDRIPMPLFLSTLKANASLGFHFMLFFAEELRRSEDQSKSLLNLGVEQRVAKAILAAQRCFGFDKDEGDLLAFTPSRQDLADYAGASYEATIRALSALQRRKLLKAAGPEMRIVDLKGLQALLKRP
ncbi:MAG: Crp/Fnr family transcriptional regulator [Flavobacteriales bacterium]|jgi:CRP-like cAMP-binding protein|nr:Crp/Fnr family transcriptional regulator [Flavobacteriales bacterium]